MKPLISLILLSLCISGCAGWRQARESWKRNQAPDVSISREERRAQVAREFDLKRDDAQFEAAIARWQTGDADGAKKLLTALLARNENHQRGRMLLADIHVFSGNNSAAIAELEKAVATAPQDAAAQHSLAQVLDAEGRREESLFHYERAVKLDTESDLYQLSYDTAVSGGSKDRVRQASYDATSRSKEVEDKTPKQSLPAAKLPGANARWSNKPPVVPIDAKPCTCGAHANCPAFPIDGAAQCHDKSCQHKECHDKNCHGATCDCPKSAQCAEKTKPAAVTNPMGFAVACDQTPAADEAKSHIEVREVPAMPNRPQAPVVQPVTFISPISPTANESAPKSTNIATLSTNDPLTTAVAALAEGDNAAAIDAATAGLAASPAQPAPLYRVLGMAHYRRGEFQAAQSALAQALSLDKADALAYFLMGSTLAKLGEPEAAAAHLAEAARLDPRFGH